MDELTFTYCRVAQSEDVFSVSNISTTYCILEVRRSAKSEIICFPHETFRQPFRFLKFGGSVKFFDVLFEGLFATNEIKDSPKL